MFRLNPLLSAVTLCAALLGASEAQAVPCSEYLAPFVAWGNGYNHVDVTIVSNQAPIDKGQGSIASASGSYTQMAKMKPYAGWLNSNWSVWGVANDGRIGPGKWTFSDRVSGTQPFVASAADPINVYIAENGSGAYIHNVSWGSWIWVSPLTCDRGVMYGFGNAIVSGPGALYVFSLSYGVDIN